MQQLLNHLLQRHVVPVLLLPVVLSGLGCFEILLLPEAFLGPSKSDLLIVAVLSLIGVFGTATTFLLLRAIRRQPNTWGIF